MKKIKKGKDSKDFKIDAKIIETVIDLAQEIGTQREGRPIGTAFIIGNKNDLMKYTKQLIKINPFKSLPESSRKITDQCIKEALKNLAQLDGVILIDNSGIVLSAGTYINIKSNNLNGAQGLGTRHRQTAAITQLTDAIGVVLSASTGTVRIYKKGKMVIKLPLTPTM